MGQNQTYTGAIMTHAQEQRRKQAVVRDLAGDKIAAMCRDLHCANSWLYTWKARDQADDPKWAKGLSPQPRYKPSQVPQRIEQRVVELRRTLVQRGQHGSAASIQQELEQQGIKPIPSSSEEHPHRPEVSLPSFLSRLHLDSPRWNHRWPLPYPLH